MSALFAVLVLALLPSGNRMVFDNALKEVMKADIAADAAWDGCRTPAAFDRHRQEVRKALVASFGGYPERCALNAKTVTVVPRDGYTVAKVIFESRPNHHVTGNLFLPDPAKFPGKRPGIVLPCGHSLNGKGATPYQRGAVKAAKKGMIVLLYDPIDQGERWQSRGIRKEGPTGGHNLVGRRAQLLGWNALTFRVWDGIRALDYLESRDDVDASRLGVMGHSGGGTMTSWIMCLDDRIRCAAPSGYLTTQRSVCEQIGPQDAEQFTFGSLAFGFNHLGHILLRAPSPVLLCSSYADFFPYSGVLETAGRAERAYAMLGSSGKFRLSDTYGPHAWHESTSSYAVDWMDYHLNGGPEPKPMQYYRDQEYGFDFKDVDTALSNGDEAFVTATGSVLDLPDERTVYDIMKETAAARKAARRPLDPALVRSAVGIRAPSEIGFREVRPGIVMTDDETPVVLTGSKGSAILYVSDERKPAAPSGAAIAEIRGFGENATSRHVYYGIKDGDEEIAQLYALVGVNLVAKRAEDIIVAAKALGGRAKLVAKGRAAIPAAFAYYTARELFSGIEVVEAPASWQKLFDDDSVRCRFADVPFRAWDVCDWTDLIR